MTATEFTQHINSFSWSEDQVTAILGISRNTYFVYKRGERDVPQSIALLLKIFAEHPRLREKFTKQNCNHFVAIP
jgi:hypothetical protein